MLLAYPKEVKDSAWNAARDSAAKDCTAEAGGIVKLKCCRVAVRAAAAAAASAI
jgi:hypothetical protein